MKTTSNIGLPIEASKNIASQLNNLLANYQMLYMNLRGFHWNIKGNNFFELHLKFEELYNDALIKVDEIAERVLTLGNTPTHSFSKYVAQSKIEAVEDIKDGSVAITNILNGLSILLQKERAILEMASKANDEGTVSLMSDYIVQQEKLVWMLTAYSN